MIYRIADLNVKIPQDGGYYPHLEDYKTNQNVSTDITIRTDLYKLDRWGEVPSSMAIYMESGSQFYRHLLKFNGIYLHSSAIALDGKAYLFSGQSGIGKSTHTRLWQQVFGAEKAIVFNDDKPALRRLDDGWFAYGTPWCGKDGINVNMKVPLAGICFLKRADENSIRRLSKVEAVACVLSQTIRRFKSEEKLNVMLDAVDKLVSEVPIYELSNKPEPEAALLSYNTMSRALEAESNEN